MKYYGSVYKGNIDAYDTKILREFDDPYEALKLANSEWNANPEAQIARLLIVIRENEANEKQIIDDKAYFQFTNTKVCRSFIDNRCDIEWSTSEKQKWNGDAKIMV